MIILKIAQGDGSPRARRQKIRKCPIRKYKEDLLCLLTCTITCYASLLSV